MLRKILYISYDQYFLSIHSHEIITNFIKLGIEVELLVPNNVKVNFELHEKCNTFKIPILFSQVSMAGVVYQVLIFFFLLIKISADLKPDLIYARQNYLGIVPVILSKIFNIPYFAEMNNIVRTLKNDTKSQIKSAFENLALKHSDIIITPSFTLKQRLIKKYKIDEEKVFVISNGVNPGLFSPHGKTTIKRREVGLEDDDFVIGFIGSLGEWQGLEVIKQTIEYMAENIKDAKIKFLIVGDYSNDANFGNLGTGLFDGQKKLTKFISSKRLKRWVRTHGFVPYEKSSEFMKICDILIAPYTSSYLEFGGGSPMKLYAYLGCAKPVIISDLGEFTDAELLRKNNAAFIVPPNSIRAIADGIEILKENQKLREGLGKNGRKFVLEERKWSDSCHGILSIFQQEIKKHKY